MSASDLEVYLLDPVSAGTGQHLPEADRNVAEWLPGARTGYRGGTLGWRGLARVWSSPISEVSRPGKEWAG